MKLPFQIMLYFSGFALLIGSLTAFGIGRTTQEYLIENQHQNSKLLSQIMAKSISSDTINGDVILARDTLTNMVDKHNIIHYAYITDFEGRLFAHTFEKEFPPQLASLELIPGGQHLTLAPHGIKIQHQSYPLTQGMNARLHVGLNQTSNLNFIKNVKIETIQSSAIVSVVGLAIAYFFCTRICRPLETLTAHIEAYGRGELKEEIAVDEKTLEVSQLAQEFNRMINQRAKAEKLSLRFGRILDNSFNEIFIFNSDTLRFVQANRGAQANIGYNLKELLEMTPLDIKPEMDEEDFGKLIAPLISEKQTIILFETIHQRKDGTTYSAEIRLQLMREENPPVYVAIVQDITERKKAEKKILEAKEEAEDASRSKSIFLANMSHEIRTPLNAINGYSQILLRKTTLDEDTREAIKTMDRSGKNLLTLINEILDISKIEAGKLELNVASFNLTDMINNLASLFELRCQQKGLSWNIKGFSSPFWVCGDEPKLQQVLTNLIGNAVKFTDFGEVSFSVNPLDNGLFKFSIVDTGPGIEQDRHEKIFEAFRQEKSTSMKGGTGLGLSISKKMVELMGSELLLESKFGAGSHFHFRLELPAGKEVEVPVNFSSAKVLHLAPGQEVTALIVDDVKENRDVVSRLLTDIGVQVFEAENGKEGVEQTRKHLPDIIFMDMRMPVMNGDQATKLIHDEFGKEKFKILAITASTLDRKREYYLDLGFDEYISKPFREEQIFHFLGELLNLEFIYDDAQLPSDASLQIPESDLSQFSILKDLQGRLISAAENYNITDMEELTEELRLLDADSNKLSQHMEQMLKNYDMEGIAKALKKVQTI
jgi:PAS domain S-box-containing protein